MHIFLKTGHHTCQDVNFGSLHTSSGFYYNYKSPPPPPPPPHTHTLTDKVSRYITSRGHFQNIGLGKLGYPLTQLLCVIDLQYCHRNIYLVVVVVAVEWWWGLHEDLILPRDYMGNHNQETWSSYERNSKHLTCIFLDPHPHPHSWYVLDSSLESPEYPYPTWVI